MHEPTTGPAADSAAPARPSVCIVGNSNSLMKGGYCQVLVESGLVDIENLSIGGTTNVLLANVLDSGRAYEADYVIVETCVLDQHHGASGAYPRESGQEALELFITEMRARSNAHIIILMIPTRFGLLEPQKQWAEPLYRETSERFGVPVLDGYALFRDLLGRRQAARGATSIALARTLLDAFGLPQKPGPLYMAHLGLAWTALRDARQPGNALGWFGFGDNLHLSARMHRLLGEMLLAYIQGVPHRGGLRVPQPAERVVENAPPLSDGPFLRRDSRLIARRLAIVDAETEVTYRCAAGWKAVGLLINDKATIGQVRLRSGQDQEEVTAIAAAHPSTWIARVLALSGRIGDADVTVGIVPLPRQPDGAAAQGEVAEMTLVRRDWRQVRDPAAAMRPDAFIRIDQTAPARALLASAVTEAEDLASVVNQGGFVAPEMMTILPTLATLEDADDPVLTLARTFLLFHDFGKLRAFLATCPDSDRIARCREGFASTFGRPPDDAAAFLGTIRALRNDGRLAEAAAACLEAEALFLNDPRFPIEHAFTARAAQDIDLAASLWRQVREDFPAANTGYIGEANTRFELCQRDESLKIIRTAVERFPNDLAIWIAAARLAGQCGELDESLERWARVREKFPSDPGGWLGAVRTLREARRPAEAAALLRDALHRWPEHVELQREMARVAPMLASPDDHRAVANG